MSTTEELELSFSAIETFNLCPRKYYYNYILKLPKKNWPWLVFGTFVHLVLEKFHKYILYHRKRNLSIDHVDLMKRAYLSGVRVYKRLALKNKKPSLTDKQKKEAKDILARHLKEMKKVYPDVVFVEKGFRLKIGDFVIRGFIDRVDKIGDNLYEVIDYKTSSRSYKVNKNKQLAIYSYALKCILKNQEININKKLDFIKLHVVEDGKYKDNEKDEVIKYITETGQKIKSDKETKKNEADWEPKDNEFCKFCDFKDRCYMQRNIIFDGV